MSEEEPIVEEQETKGVRVFPAVRQLINSKLAQFCVEGRGSDLYHLMEVVEILRVVVGEQPLKDHYKEKYPQHKIYLDNLNVKLNKVKMYYDSIRNLDEAKKEQRLKSLFRKELAGIPLISRALFKTFILLLDKTEIKFMSIPNEYFKRMEKTEKVIEPDKDKKKKKKED